MQITKLAILLLTLSLATMSVAKTPHSTGKGSVPGSKAAASKSSSSKAGASSRSKTKSTKTNRARRAAPARQQQPTAERYMQIQQALAEKGYYNGSVDGSWDAQSIEALKRFQADQNLPADGKLGALSLIGLGLGPKREPLPPQFASKPESVQP